MPEKKKLKSKSPASSAFPVEDPDHHLVLNRGFWWVCCSINATPKTKEKLGYSLRTKDLPTARLRRDVFLHGLHAEGLEVRLRRQSPVSLTALGQVSAERLALPWKHRVADVLTVALATTLESEVTRPLANSGKSGSPNRRPRRRPALAGCP